jgi:hypothetical protein
VAIAPFDRPDYGRQKIDEFNDSNARTVHCKRLLEANCHEDFHLIGAVTPSRTGVQYDLRHTFRDMVA